jgi:cardiolipin synthase A/B
MHFTRLLGLLLLCTSQLFGMNHALAFGVQFGVAPDNDQQLLTQTLQSAQRELIINVYQFDSPAVAQAILDKIQSGITVQILLEGTPIPRISDQEKKTISEVVNAMRSSGNPSDHLYEMKSASANDFASKGRRFKYDHAKYVVVDQQFAVIASENYTTTGHPDAGKVGNRGWEVVLDDADLAAQLSQIFTSDTDLSYGDIQELTSTNTESSQPAPTPAAKNRQMAAVALGSGDATSVQLVTSPNSQQGIVNFIQSATQTLEVEQMSLPLYWKQGGEELSPTVQAIIDAAKRGVAVEVLLNDDNTFGKPENAVEGDGDDFESGKQTNLNTVDYLNQLGVSSLQARIVNVKAVEITYIHNKGFIADDQRVFVSSINGTRNSVMNNREVAVNIESPDAATYYKSVFDFDWDQSASSNVMLNLSEMLLNF